MDKMCKCLEEDYFSLLMHRDDRAHSALEMFVDDLHLDKEKTITIFFCHSGCEDFLWGLVRLLGSNEQSQRVAGNSAYILGTLAESELGCYRVLSLTHSPHEESRHILSDLTNMLAFNDSESVMNAAGTLGTLAESHEGREWMLSEPCLLQMVTNVTALLDCENLWTASNAALVLARLSIAEDGCNHLLEHIDAQLILRNLVQSLGVDEAGRGMNAAFAVGRLCDMSRGREQILALPESGKMISALAHMLCSDNDGASKNSCFALSCLAASADGHAKLLINSQSDEILTRLSELLSSDDSETGWFAAMTLRTLASQPQGCLFLREHKIVTHALKGAEVSDDVCHDLKEEVTLTLEILKRLSKPAPPCVTVSGCDRVEISCDTVTPKSGLAVTYQIFDASVCVYKGRLPTCAVDNLQPCTQYAFRVRHSTEGDESPLSDPVSIITEETLPKAPENVSILGTTTTLLKIGWDPPVISSSTLKGYYIYLGETQVDFTSELSSIVTSLTPNTSYTIQVCAFTSKGRGPKSTVTGTTAETGAHTPTAPTVSVLGRNEIHLAWKPPEVPLGRITRYDVLSNGKVLYSGTELSFTARRLVPDTEYSFVVVALTSEGRFESKATKRRTAKDEYEVQRPPLYQTPQRKDDMEVQVKSVIGVNQRRHSKDMSIISTAATQVQTSKQSRTIQTQTEQETTVSDDTLPAKQRHDSLSRRRERTYISPKPQVKNTGLKLPRSSVLKPLSDGITTNLTKSVFPLTSSYAGSLLSDNKPAALPIDDDFMIPTFGENYLPSYHNQNGNSTLDSFHENVKVNTAPNRSRRSSLKYSSECQNSVILGTAQLSLSSNASKREFYHQHGIQTKPEITPGKTVRSTLCRSSKSGQQQAVGSLSPKSISSIHTWIPPFDLPCTQKPDLQHAKFVPMQYRTQPANLSLTSIQRMNSQVLSTNDFNLSKTMERISRSATEMSLSH